MIKWAAQKFHDIIFVDVTNTIIQTTERHATSYGVVANYRYLLKQVRMLRIVALLHSHIQGGIIYPESIFDQNTTSSTIVASSHYYIVIFKEVLFIQNRFLIKILPVVPSSILIWYSD